MYKHTRVTVTQWYNVFVEITSNAVSAYDNKQEPVFCLTVRMHRCQHVLIYLEAADYHYCYCLSFFLLARLHLQKCSRPGKNWAATLVGDDYNCSAILPELIRLRSLTCPTNIAWPTDKLGIAARMPVPTNPWPQTMAVKWLIFNSALTAF